VNDCRAKIQRHIEPFFKDTPLCEVTADSLEKFMMSIPRRDSNLQNGYSRKTINLILSDIIYADRGLYRHYGIYVNDSRVIHYAAGNADFGINVRVQETTLDRFKRDSPWGVYRFPRAYRTLSPRETVRRARSRLGECEYSLFTNNCEHFAFWCKTGTSRSPQLDGFLDQASLVPLIGGCLRLILDEEARDNLGDDVRDSLTGFLNKIEEGCWDILLWSLDL
jgi:hypothetical protein